MRPCATSWASPRTSPKPSPSSPRHAARNITGQVLVADGGCASHVPGIAGFRAFFGETRMSNYDIVVMGAGHNQLGAAAYLAKAGKKVLVLEMKEFIGGGAVTLERTAPGFLHNKHSAMHGMIQANPLLVNDELRLKSKYGLDYFYPEAPMGLLLKDFRHFLTYVDVDKTCQEIAKYSEKDADAYREFVMWGARMMPMLLQGMFNVPIPMGPFMAMMESNEDGRRMLDLMFRSPLQIVDELFETDILKIHLLKWVSEGILQFPDDMGTGFGLIIMILLVHFYPVGLPDQGQRLAQPGAGRLHHRFWRRNPAQHQGRFGDRRERPRGRPALGRWRGVPRQGCGGRGHSPGAARQVRLRPRCRHAGARQAGEERALHLVQGRCRARPVG